MFYRSIAETFLKTRKEPLNCEIKLKKLAKKCPSFHEYFVKVVKKFNLDIEVSLDKCKQFNVTSTTTHSHYLN